jgi:hypothetical protein
MLWAAIFFAGCLALLGARVPNSFQTTRSAGSLSRNYLGFDRNRYPGDAVLGLLRETFYFCGYWLNVPPGEVSNTWEGKLWIDRQDLGWIKVDGQVIQPFSIGLFLARVLRGSHITMEQTRVDDRIWMPARVEVQAVAKIFFVKNLVIDQVLTYLEYRLAEAGVSTARHPVNTIP